MPLQAARPIEAAPSSSSIRLMRKAGDSDMSNPLVTVLPPKQKRSTAA
jgi:hypothetical protein